MQSMGKWNRNGFFKPFTGFDLKKCELFSTTFWSTIYRFERGGTPLKNRYFLSKKAVIAANN